MIQAPTERAAQEHGETPMKTNFARLKLAQESAIIRTEKELGKLRLMTFNTPEESHTYEVLMDRLEKNLQRQREALATTMLREKLARQDDPQQIAIGGEAEAGSPDPGQKRSRVR